MIERRSSSLPSSAASQHLDAAFAERPEVLAHGGQRREEVLRLRQVVEADDAHVVRHANAAFGEAVDQTERDLIVGREDRRCSPAGVRLTCATS